LARCTKFVFDVCGSSFLLFSFWFIGVR
jgi:hypothetical protein